MKVIVTADWHLDSVTLGVSRFDDLSVALRQLMTTALQERPRLFLFLGDLCNPDRGARTLKAISTVALYARMLAENDIESVWLAGNHDVVDSSDIVSSLTPLGSMPFLHVVEKLGSMQIDGWHFVFLPYISRVLQAEIDVRRFVERECVLAADKGLRTVIAGHCTHIDGAVNGNETTLMPRGRTMAFPTDIGKRYGAIMFNGHYHTRQHTPSGVYIPGSLGRFDFGEERNTPSFYVFDTEVNPWPED
jgi:DNA repair exonuclease SbcCD nuclease subunit